MLAVALGASRPSDYRTVVDIDGIGFATNAQGIRDSAPEELQDENVANAGDAEWHEAEINRDVDKVAALGCASTATTG